jgi:hypothetical protein
MALMRFKGPSGENKVKGQKKEGLYAGAGRDGNCFSTMAGRWCFDTLLWAGRTNASAPIGTG